MQHRRVKASMLFLVAAALALSVTVRAQDEASPPPLKPEELEQLVAPIALYPDSLLAQVLMASTYPLEVVEAARWVKGALASGRTRVTDVGSHGAGGKQDGTERGGTDAEETDAACTVGMCRRQQ
jgi:hypothetical protein